MFGVGERREGGREREGERGREREREKGEREERERDNSRSNGLQCSQSPSFLLCLEDFYIGILSLHAMHQR